MKTRLAVRSGQGVCATSEPGGARRGCARGREHSSPKSSTGIPQGKIRHKIPWMADVHCMMLTSVQ